MTSIRFLSIKNLKVIIISICLRVIAFCPSYPEFGVASSHSGTLCHSQSLAHSSANQSRSILVHPYIKPQNVELYLEQHFSLLRLSRQSHNSNLNIQSEPYSTQEVEEIEVDHQRQLYQVPTTRMSRDSQHISDYMNNPSSQVNLIEEGDYLDANKINDSRLATRSVNVKTIETAIFADRALNQKFIGRGGLIELNKLILTIMNQVQLIFSFKSMKTPIKINIVRIEHLKDVADAPSTENGDIDGYLSSFCKWQHNMLLRDRNLAWDHAILLTGLDLYKSTLNRNHSGVLGLAWVGGMCKLNYSCTINEALSLESSFVIAHEMGHSLGILHDGQQNNCDRNNYIMSERTGAGKIHWSTCSNYYLNDAIRRKQLFCLDNERNSITDIYNLSKMKPPGLVYTINDQCKLAFGNNYTAFTTREKPFNSVCRELWCVAGTWAKAAHPALEGSLCGDTNKFCSQGDCKQYV